MNTLINRHLTDSVRSSTEARYKNDTNVNYPISASRSNPSIEGPTCPKTHQNAHKLSTSGSKRSVFKATHEWDSSISELAYRSKETRFGRIDTQRSMLPGLPESASCVQRFDDSLNSAIRITYRISLRSSSVREPRYPLLRVVRVI